MKLNNLKPLPPRQEARPRVQALQEKLHARACEDPSKVFDDIANLIYDPAVLREAAVRVLSNEGAVTPGVDGITKHNILGTEEVLLELREKLKTGKYYPTHLRPTDIPKANGKMRRLEIPTLTDRIVQKAVCLILEPIFEADFLPCSYAYRPDRSCQGAIVVIHDGIRDNSTLDHVVDADIANCFGTIPHGHVLRRLRTRTNDAWVIRLIKMFVQAGTVQPDGSVLGRTKGISQGGPLSPFLCNVCLTELDEGIDGGMSPSGARRSSPATATHPAYKRLYVRYADDLAILTDGGRNNAEETKAHVASLLERLEMSLSEAKTEIRDLRDGFNFLGYRIQKADGRDGTLCHLSPSKKSVERLLEKLINIEKDDNQTTKVVNAVRGFLDYYGPASDADMLETVNSIEETLQQLGLGAMMTPAQGSDRTQEFAAQF